MGIDRMAGAARRGDCAADGRQPVVKAEGAERKRRCGFRLPALLLSLALLLPAVLSASENHWLDHRLDPQGLLVETSRGPLRLRFHHAEALEVHYQPEGLRQLPSFSIATEPAPVAATLVEDEQELVYASTRLTARIRKAPLRIRFEREGQLLLEEESGLFAEDTMRGFRFALEPGEKLMGAGQRVLGMDRRGHRLPLYNRPHYGYTTRSEQMYYSLPALLSSRKYLLLFDNSARGEVDLGHAEPDVLQFQAVAGRTAYLVFSGASYPELLAHYVAVTGRQPLPPRWALGNYASRFGYRSEAEVRDVVRRFRAADIPLDAVVLDLYWFGPDIKGHMGALDWDRNSFPTAEAMIADLAADGVRTVLVTEPFILTSSTRWREAVAAGALARNLAGRPKTFDFYFGNSGLIDIFDPDARAWFWGIYAGLQAQGVAGWWGDLGEPEVHPADTVHALGMADAVHNAYGHEWARLVYEGERATRPDRRPFVMMRAGFAGSQRYGMIPWTGDVERSWDGLKPQVELGLQMGLLGLAYTHSDLGGFAGGESFDAELYTRWLQYGVFQPVYRPHAQDHIPSEPVFHDAETLRLARESIRLRYRLLPYLYTMAFDNSRTGMPLMRPLFFSDETRPELIERSDAYFWGDELLVAPVLEAGLGTLQIDVPQGIWFDFHDSRRIEGGTSHRYTLDRQRIPVLVRAGALLPMVDPVAHTGLYSTRQLQLHHYPDPSVARSTGRVYDDDGETPDAYALGAYDLLHIEAEDDGKTLLYRFRREGGDWNGRPELRRIEMIIHHPPRGLRELTLHDATHRIGAKAASDTANATPSAWHDRHQNRLHLRFDWNGEDLELRLE